MNIDKGLNQLAIDIIACQKILVAIGDESRQHIILEMLTIGDCSGARVGQIAEKTSLSRPAVSHHLQILKDAGIVKMRKEGTKNFYYFDADVKSFDRLIQMLEDAKEIMRSLPDRSGND